MDKISLSNYLDVFSKLIDDMIELTPEQIGILKDEIRDKVDSYVGLFNQMQAQAELLKKQAKEFSEKAKSLENSRKNLMNHLGYTLEINHTPEIYGDQYRIKVAKSQSVDIKEEVNDFYIEKYPELIRTKIVHEWDKSALKIAIENNPNLIGFAKLKTNYRATIKPRGLQ